jgi:hypothetical protein
VSLVGSSKEGIPTLRERVDDALTHIAEMDGGKAWETVDEILLLIYRALKQDLRFDFLTHDQFDLLTAPVRERLSEELDERIGGLVSIDDVYRVLEQADAAE